MGHLASPCSSIPHGPLPKINPKPIGEVHSPGCNWHGQSYFGGWCEGTKSRSPNSRSRAKVPELGLAFAGRIFRRFPVAVGIPLDPIFASKNELKANPPGLTPPGLPLRDASFETPRDLAFLFGGFKGKPWRSCFWSKHQKRAPRSTTHKEVGHHSQNLFGRFDIPPFTFVFESIRFSTRATTFTFCRGERPEPQRRNVCRRPTGGPTCVYLPSRAVCMGISAGCAWQEAGGCGRSLEVPGGPGRSRAAREDRIGRLRWFSLLLFPTWKKVVWFEGLSLESGNGSTREVPGNGFPFQVAPKACRSLCERPQPK